MVAVVNLIIAKETFITLRLNDGTGGNMYARKYLNGGLAGKQDELSYGVRCEITFQCLFVAFRLMNCRLYCSEGTYVRVWARLTSDINAEAKTASSLLVESFAPVMDKHEIFFHVLYVARVHGLPAHEVQTPVSYAHNLGLIVNVLIDLFHSRRKMRI